MVLISCYYGNASLITMVLQLSVITTVTTNCDSYISHIFFHLSCSFSIEPCLSNVSQSPLPFYPQTRSFLITTFHSSDPHLIFIFSSLYHPSSSSSSTHLSSPQSYEVLANVPLTYYQTKRKLLSEWFFASSEPSQQQVHSWIYSHWSQSWFSQLVWFPSSHMSNQN